MQNIISENIRHRQENSGLCFKNQQNGTFQGIDMRGKMPSANKTSEARVNDVRKHIESFPTVESHDTRKRSKRQYLNGDLIITKMYSMYNDKCVIEKRNLTEKVYRNIFCKNYNLSFHKPKKDQCSFCTLYLQHKMNGMLTPEMENDFKNTWKVKLKHEMKKAKIKKPKKIRVCTHAHLN